MARAAASGDPRASGVLWDRFSPLVRRILRRTLGPGAAVDGLLQEVFLRVVRQLGSVPESAQLKPLVVSTAVRVLNAELKRHRMRRLLRLRSPWAVTGEENLAGNDTTNGALAAVYRILDGLDPEARLAFTLRHFEGLPITELATAMDASLASAKRRLARASAHVQAAVGSDAAFSAYAHAANAGDAP